MGSAGSAGSAGWGWGQRAGVGSAGCKDGSLLSWLKKEAQMRRTGVGVGLEGLSDPKDKVLGSLLCFPVQGGWGVGMLPGPALPLTGLGLPQRDEWAVPNMGLGDRERGSGLRVVTSTPKTQTSFPSARTS